MRWKIWLDSNRKSRCHKQGLCRHYKFSLRATHWWFVLDKKYSRSVSRLPQIEYLGENWELGLTFLGLLANLPDIRKKTDRITYLSVPDSSLDLLDKNDKFLSLKNTGKNQLEMSRWPSLAKLDIVKRPTISFLLNNEDPELRVLSLFD